MLFIYFVLIIVILILWLLLASNASDIAADKGYPKRKWFHMCFWLAPFSYILVAAMPDKVLREKQEQTNRLLEQLLAASEAPGKAPGETPREMPGEAHAPKRLEEAISDCLPDL